MPQGQPGENDRIPGFVRRPPGKTQSRRKAVAERRTGDGERVKAPSAKERRENVKTDAKAPGRRIRPRKIKDATAAAQGKKETVTQKSISKKLFAFALAVMMLVSVTALSASAATVDGGVTTPVNARL